jgi:hypothetical protein
LVERAKEAFHLAGNLDGAFHGERAMTPQGRRRVSHPQLASSA